MKQFVIVEIRDDYEIYSVYGLFDSMDEAIVKLDEINKTKFAYQRFVAISLRAKDAIK